MKFHLCCDAMGAILFEGEHTSTDLWFPHLDGGAGLVRFTGFRVPYLPKKTRETNQKFDFKFCPFCGKYLVDPLEAENAKA